MPTLVSTGGTLVVVAAAAYLLGSVSFGVIMARVFGLGDLRQVGSGNIGATNVLRTGNKTAAALTLLLDAAKGAAAVLIARLLVAGDAAQVAGLAAFVGHLYPVFLGFKGGKGVATFLGVVLALAWPVGLACCGTWALIAATTRYSSLAALVAAGLSPLWLLVFARGDLLILSLILTLLVYLRHAANIRRLQKGTEPKIGTPKKTAAQ